MDPLLITILGVLGADIVLTFVGYPLLFVSLYRKVAYLMASQADLKTALDATESNLDEVATILELLVDAGGAANVMTQAQLDVFTTQAQGIRAKAEAVTEAAKALEPKPEPPTPPIV